MTATQHGPVQHGPTCVCDACLDRDERAFTVWHEQETGDGETEEERAEREAAGLAPGEEWQGWWERCWFCPRALKTVEENVAGVCTACQAKGRVFPARPAVPLEQRVAEARATLERLIREEIAPSAESAKSQEDDEEGTTPCHS